MAGTQARRPDRAGALHERVDGAGQHRTRHRSDGRVAFTVHHAQATATFDTAIGIHAGGTPRRLCHGLGAAHRAVRLAAAPALALGHGSERTTALAYHTRPLGPGTDRRAGAEGNPISALGSTHPPATPGGVTTPEPRMATGDHLGICTANGLVARGLAASAVTHGRTPAGGAGLWSDGGRCGTGDWPDFAADAGRVELAMAARCQPGAKRAGCRSRLDLGRHCGHQRSFGLGAVAGTALAAPPRARRAFGANRVAAPGYQGSRSLRAMGRFGLGNPLAGNHLSRRFMGIAVGQFHRQLALSGPAANPLECRCMAHPKRQFVHGLEHILDGVAQRRQRLVVGRGVAGVGTRALAATHAKSGLCAPGFAGSAVGHWPAPPGPALGVGRHGHGCLVGALAGLPALCAAQHRGCLWRL